MNIYERFNNYRKAKTTQCCKCGVTLIASVMGVGLHGNAKAVKLEFIGISSIKKNKKRSSAVVNVEKGQ